MNKRVINKRNTCEAPVVDRGEGAVALYFWDASFLYVGRGFDADLHRHHAIQILVSPDRPFRVGDGSSEACTEAMGVRIRENALHEVYGTHDRIALYYAEPGGRAARTFGKIFGTESIEPFAPDRESVKRLLDVAVAASDPEVVLEHLAALLGSNDVSLSNTPIDPRVRETIEALRNRGGRHPGLRALAEAVQLSPSYLARKFQSETGIPIRRFALWERVKSAVRFATEGYDLTRSAHEAGFSDSAHFSRSFRAMFGVAPSFVFDPRIELTVKISSER